MQQQGPAGCRVQACAACIKSALQPDIRKKVVLTSASAADLEEQARTLEAAIRGMHRGAPALGAIPESPTPSASSPGEDP